MSMPPPLEPKFEKEEDPEDKESDICRSYVKQVLDRARKLGIGDYIAAFGAGLIAFKEARDKRHEREPEEREI